MPERITQYPILLTKLNIPSIQGSYICRKRLLDQLDRGREGPLTLVSAPAGYGKSLLVAHWAESLDIPCGWLSLDESDSDLAAFALYFIAAIRSAIPGAMTTSLELTTTSPLPPVEIIAGQMLNEFQDLDPDLVLVLDDYHRIGPGSKVHELIRALLGHPPSGLTIVLATRTDPPLPMTALRAGRQMVEVRLRDLQFTIDETASYLLQNLGQVIEESALANLMVQTEGWAVGLQFVGLHLQEIDDPNSFLLSLQGGVLQTQEYLLHEVLRRQPGMVRECMLKASILDRFNADILDFVCNLRCDSGSEKFSGREFIDLLLQENLFTISLDTKGEWFRYQHNFQGLLSWELARYLGEEEIADLYLLASKWFESKGLIDESIRFAVKAERPKRAGEIFLSHWNQELNKDHWFVIEQWLGMLPDRFIQNDPELLLAKAWTMYYRLRPDLVAVLLERAEAIKTKQDLSAGLLAAMGFFRGYLEYWSGESAASVSTLENSLELLVDQESFCAAEIQMHLAFARCMEGQWEQAIQVLEDLIGKCVSAAGIYFSHILGAKMFVRLLCSQLPLACADAERLVSVSARDGLGSTEGWGHFIMGSCQLAAGKFEGAAASFTLAIRNRYSLDPMAVADAFVGLAIARQMLQMDSEADIAIQNLREFAAESDDPHRLRVAESGRARLSLMQGQSPTDLSWAMSDVAQPGPDELFIWVEVPLMTRIRVLVASNSNKGLELASDLLRDLRAIVEKYHFTGQLIEVLVLQSVALDLQEHTEEANSVLLEALAMAETGSWVRPFLEVGSVMPRMLHRLGERTVEDHFIRYLLGFFETSETLLSHAPAKAKTGGALEENLNFSLNPLTNRELDVLGLLARRLHNKEIADSLCVSSHTVNFHLKQIYGKLEVHNRRQAVDRALELGIISLRSPQ